MTFSTDFRKIILTTCHFFLKIFPTRDDIVINKRETEGTEAVSAMKIDDKPILPATIATRNDAAAALADSESHRNGTAAAGHGGDTVKLSDNAERVARMSEALQQIPDIRVERVQELKKQVAAGEYTVDARAVAEKMFMAMKKGIAV